MSIEIPDALIKFVVRGGLWALAVLVVFSICALAMRYVVYCLKNRKSYWCAIAFLTTKKQRSKADAWTIDQFRSLESRLAIENPKFLGKIREALSEWEILFSFDGKSIKKCPYCQNPDTWVNHRNKTQYRVQCESCKAAGSTEKTPDEAAAKWNSAQSPAKE